MMPLEEAQARVNRDLAMLPTTDVAIADALGMVLAETVVADEAIPPFANTAMDGFAVRAADTIGATKESPVSLPVVGTIAAGSVAERPLEAGEAMRIMTGAPVPPGSDAIIMVELTRPNGFDVDLLAEVPIGNHVRPAGDDIQKGTEILHPGTVVGPGHLGVLASLGRQTITVYRRPRVGVMSTGDELVDGGEPLEPGQIRDSNRVMLLALVAEDVEWHDIAQQMRQIHGLFNRGHGTGVSRIHFSAVATSMFCSGTASGGTSSRRKAALIAALNTGAATRPP